MTNIRREVCKRANILMKHSYSRSGAFKKAWAEAKAAANCVKVADLTAGQAIRIEYGDFNNFVTCTVSEVSKELVRGKYHVIKALTKYGAEIEFVAAPDELIAKAA